MNGSIYMTEPVNPIHPDYYLSKSMDGVSCWNAIESAVGQKGFEDYCVGCITKYLFRFREKNGVLDLQKAQNYLRFLIESYSRKGQGDV